MERATSNEVDTEPTETGVATEKARRTPEGQLSVAAQQSEVASAAADWKRHDDATATPPAHPEQTGSATSATNEDPPSRRRAGGVDKIPEGQLYLLQRNNLEQRRQLQPESGKTIRPRRRQRTQSERAARQATRRTRTRLRNTARATLTPQTGSNYLQQRAAASQLRGRAQTGTALGHHRPWRLAWLRQSYA